MKSHRRTAILGVGLLAAGAVLVAAYLIHFQAKWAVARYERQLVAAGETLAVGPLLPPPVLPENNGAALFRHTGFTWGANTNVLNKNPPPAMQMVAPGKAMVGWAQPDVRIEGTNTWAQVEEALAQYRDSLDLVREATERPVLDFQLDYRQGFSLPLPHLAPLKRATQLLSIAALCDLHRGDVAAATTNIETMLALVNATTGERLAISQLVRIAMAAITVNATWEALQSPRPSEEQLAVMQRDWTQVRFIQPAQDALALERALNLLMLRRMRNSSSQFRQVISLGGGGSGSTGTGVGDVAERLWQETVLGAREASWRLSSSYPDQLRSLKGYQVLLESYRSVQSGQPFVVAFTRQKARLAELGLHNENEESSRRFDPSWPDLNSLFSDSVVALGRMLHRVFTAEATRELTITALALKRYQLRQGQYPATLSALVPEFLPAPPRDPADGRPLRYQLRPDGTFLLYSIGEDGIDNGGDASPAAKPESHAWQQGQDLVWPWPATAEEVSAYQQKHAIKRGR